MNMDWGNWGSTFLVDRANVQSSMAELDVMSDWKRGAVPHVQPQRPATRMNWPKVSAGPQRLRKLISMWLSGLPVETQAALRHFMLLVFQFSSLWILFQFSFFFDLFDFFKQKNYYAQTF